MKKQILTLTLCLALTATTAMANTTAKVAKKAAPVKAVSNIACQKPAQEVTLTSEQLAKKKFEEKMTKDREDFYCKLGLTSEQKLKAEALDKQSKIEAEPLFLKFRAEKAKLRELKAKKTCPIMLCKQKEEVRVAKKAIRAHMKTSRKAFEALLTKEQLTQFKVIRAERKHACKKCGCDKCHHNCDVAKGTETPKCPTTTKCPCGCK